MMAEDRDWLAREQTARELGSGPDGSSATRLLLRAANDPEGEVRKAAVEALGRLRPTRRRLRALLRALSDPQWEVRWAAARSLGGVGRGSALVRATLTQACADPDAAVAEAARRALSGREER